MSVSKEERETLHVILDALLNARETIEGIDPSTIQSRRQQIEAITRPREELCRNGSVFLRRVLGPDVHRERLALLFEADLVENAVGAQLAATIANSLRVFLPLFMRQEKYEGETYGQNLTENIEKIISDLMGMYWGDEPRFFSLWPRRQGSHKRPYRIARLRLTALDWDKFLNAVGIATRDRHSFISDAYRTDWEAIRKWAKSIESQFDLRSYPPRDTEWARQLFQEDPEKIYQAILRDGDAYWEERGSARSGKID